MFPYLFIVFTYFIAKHHPAYKSTDSSGLLYVFCTSWVTFTPVRVVTIVNKHRTKKNQVFVLHGTYSKFFCPGPCLVVVVVVRYRVTIRMWPIITRTYYWSAGHGARSCDTRDKISVIMIHPVHYCTHVWWWWWSVGWLKNFPSYNSLIS